MREIRDYRGKSPRPGYVRLTGKRRCLNLELGNSMPKRASFVSCGWLQSFRKEAMKGTTHLSPSAARLSSEAMRSAARCRRTRMGAADSGVRVNGLPVGRRFLRAARQYNGSRSASSTARVEKIPKRLAKSLGERGRHVPRSRTRGDWADQHRTYNLYYAYVLKACTQPGIKRTFRMR